MKQLFSLIGFLIITCSVAAQSNNQNKKVVTNSEPTYPKGDQALYAEVYSNLEYPEEAVKKHTVGEVMLSFDVKPDSSVSNVIIISGVGDGVDEAVGKYIERLKFAPALQNGRPVKMNTIYTFPVKAH
ncbi:MAG TPA: energy transducer TonB [Bacteroidia bacterium]|jgi:protein TonB